MIRKILIISLLIITKATINSTFAGNEQRSGEAGASQLLINPWAGSSGFANSNMSSATGVEAMFLNVAGTAFVNKFDLGFSYTNYLQNSGVGINTIGFGTKAGDAGVISASLVAMSFGDIPITTVENPDGTGNTFRPTYNIISAAYSRHFSNAIKGGAVLKVVNENISTVSSTGVAIDAGIQYVTGLRDQFRFGVSMQNWGPTMRYRGEALSYRAYTTEGLMLTFEHRSSEFELPTILRIGLSYDFELAPDHNLLLAGTYTSNSFTPDQYSLGLEYGIMNTVFVRGGYAYEKDIFKAAERLTFFTGLAAGLTVKLTLNKQKNSAFNVDYSYRATNPMGGFHAIGVRITI